MHSLRPVPAGSPLANRLTIVLALSWPAVSGASGYRLRVFDLATKQEIPCPAGLDCSPTTPSAIHNGAAVSPESYGYVALAVDACGATSAD